MIASSGAFLTPVKRPVRLGKYNHTIEGWIDRVVRRVFKPMERSLYAWESTHTIEGWITASKARFLLPAGMLFYLKKPVVRFLRHQAFFFLSDVEPGGGRCRKRNISWCASSGTQMCGQCSVKNAVFEPCRLLLSTLSIQ